MGIRIAIFCWIILQASTVVAQAIRFAPGESQQYSRAELTEVTSTFERELAQIDSLAEAEAWEEAVEGITRLAAESTDAMGSISDDYFVPSRMLCQWRICQWPAKGIQEYRKSVDRKARQLYESAIAIRDTAALQQVVDKYFASSVGDDALLALSDLALQTGNYSRARGCLLQISPELSAPDGRPWGVTIGDRKLDAELINSFIKSDSKSEDLPPKLVYPDTDLPVPVLMARMAIISIRERNLQRAEIELLFLKVAYPDARGLLGGREVVLAEALAETIAAARSWQSPDQQVKRIGDIDRVVWRRKLPGQMPNGGANFPQVFSRVPNPAMVPLQVPRRSNLVHPIVGEGTIVYKLLGGFANTSQGGTWYALNAKTGEPLFGEDGKLAGTFIPAQAPRVFAGGVQIDGGGGVVIQNRVEIQFDIRNGGVFQQRLFINGNQPFTTNLAKPHATLRDNLLFAAIEPMKLVVLNLAAEGKLQLEIKPTEECYIATTPVVTADSITLVEQKSQQGGQAWIASYSRSTGRPLWRVPVCSQQGGLQSDALMIVDDKLVLTAPGLVLAVRAETGEILWARKYRLAASDVPNNVAMGAGLATPLGKGGLAAISGTIVCAPSDATGTFALDAETGRVLWINNQASGVEYLLGKRENNLIASGDYIWLLDATHGTKRMQWPDTADAALASKGRACLAGDEVFFPTAEGIRAMDVRTGQASRNPLPWEKLGIEGNASLTLCGDGILVTTEREMILLGDQSAAEPEPERPEIGLRDRASSAKTVYTSGNN